MFLLPTQADTFLLALLPPWRTPRPEGCQGLTATPAQLEREGGMSWETQVLGYRGCTGRPEHWEARDVLGERSEHWDEGDALGDPFPLRESDLQ